MKIYFGQIYIKPEVFFPFSTAFQRYLSEEITTLVAPSSSFTKNYGSNSSLIFRLSAKRGSVDNEVKGPTVFRKKNDVEYTIFLPFDVITQNSDPYKSALSFLLEGVCYVLTSLDIDPANIAREKNSLIERICLDPRMFE